jgi:hypothetical protein
MGLRRQADEECSNEVRTHERGGWLATSIVVTTREEAACAGTW